MPVQPHSLSHQKGYIRYADVGRSMSDGASAASILQICDRKLSDTLLKLVGRDCGDAAQVE